ncbi:MAG TPA: LON peptidase substrate-binding domain-containing protein, partial [Pleomorphomonadaceae bacterium]|nr:LON peptidase substrate-binding domain-containing protein [Pleomorphomonadaceae bacterium]
MSHVESENTNPQPTPPTDEPADQIQVLPLVALRGTVIFPEMIVPLEVGRDRSVKALERAVRAN